MEEKLTSIEKLLEEVVKLNANPIISVTTKEELDLKGKLAKKMASVITKSGKVEKKGTNKEQHYKFASHADIIDELRKTIAEEGIYILPKPQTYTTKDIVSKFGTKGIDIIMSMDFEIIDTETGYSMVVSWFGQGMDYGDKAVYKSYTGALKYFLLDTFMISTGDDPENDSPEEQAAPKQYAQTPRPAYTRPVAPAPKPSPEVQTPAEAPKMPPISKLQESQIRTLMKQKGKDEEDVNIYVRKAYKKLNLINYTELDKIQAESVIKKLSELPDLQPDVDIDEVDKGIKEDQEKLVK